MAGRNFRRRILVASSSAVVFVLASVLFVWASLNVFYPDKSCLPKVYTVERPLHDDWPPGLRWIRRSWTYFCVPMPPRKWAGTQDETWAVEQDCYPMAGDTEWRDIPGRYGPYWTSLGVERQYRSVPPVPDDGKWVVVSAPTAFGRIPVYAAASPVVLGHRIHLNFGLKPDTTVTFDRWNSSDGPAEDGEGNRLRPDDGCHVGDAHWGFPETSLSVRKR